MSRLRAQVVVFGVVLVLGRCAIADAQEPGPAEPAKDGAVEPTAASQAAPTTEGASETEEEDWSSFAKSLPIFGPELSAGEAMLFDLTDGTLLRSFRRYGDHLRHVRFSPDGKHALLSFYDSSILWNVDTGEADREFDQGGIAHIAHDGSTVLIYGERGANRYEVATGNLVETIRMPFSGRGFKSRNMRLNAHGANEEQYDASGALIYNTQESNYHPILDADTGKEIGLCPSGTRWCFVSGATKKVLQGHPTGPRNVVRVFDFQRKEIARLEMPPGDIPGLGGQLKAVSGDGKQFLYARPTKEVEENPGPRAQYRTRHYSVHDAATGKELKAIGNFDARYEARFSPDGRFVVLLPTFGYEGEDVRDPEILVINVSTGAVDHRIYSGPWALPSVDFDETGNRLLVAGAINFEFWRRFYEWRQLEQQNPMPRKVLDTLKIIKEWQATKVAGDNAADDDIADAKEDTDGTGDGSGAGRP